MKLCDRHYTIGEFLPGPNQVIIGVEKYDLCESCKEEIREQILNPGKKTAPKRKPGRKPKNVESKTA